MPTPLKANPRKIDRPGHEIEKFRGQLAKPECQLECKAAKMDRKGCRIAHIHFKSDRPNVMFLLEPTENGERKYVHVGTSPVKQRIVREEIERYARREIILETLRSLKTQRDQLFRELSGLRRRYYVLLFDGMNVAGDDLEGSRLAGDGRGSR